MQMEAQPSNGQLTFRQTGHADVLLCGQPYWTSLNDEDRSERYRIWQMTRDAGSDFDILVEKGPVEVSDLLVHYTEITDRDGLRRSIPVVHLITPNRDSYCIMSQYAVDDIASFVHMFGQPPFSPPVLVKAVVRKTKSGNSMNRLDIVVQ